MFEDCGISLRYINWNDVARQSIYIVAAGSRKNIDINKCRGNKISEIRKVKIGTKVITNGYLFKIKTYLRRFNVVRG